MLHNIFHLNCSFFYSLCFLFTGTRATSIFRKILCIMINFIKYNYASSSVEAYLSDGSNRSFSFSSISSFLNEMCLHFGSSLSGRIDSFKYHIGLKKKIPVFVNQYHFFIPITKDFWINYEAIHEVQYLDKKNRCTISFHDHTSIDCTNPTFIEHILRHIFLFKTKISKIASV